MADITITPGQISGILSEAIKHKISVLFAGESGIGKTEETEKTGREKLGAYMDCRLASKLSVMGRQACLLWMSLAMAVLQPS